MTRRLVLLGAVMTLVGLLTAACGDSRSPEAFCSTFRDRAIQLHDKYTRADQQASSSGDPFSAFLTLAQSPGDLQVMFQALDKVAPDDIEPSVNQMLEAMKQQQQAVNSGSLLGMMGGLMTDLESSGAEYDVDAYLSQHCDLSYMRGS
jgi:hypothetical protein